MDLTLHVWRQSGAAAQGAFVTYPAKGISPDASFLDHLPLEASSFYVMDRGYIHFARLIRFTHAAAFFVIRSMDKLNYKVLNNCPIDQAAILSDTHIVMTGRFTSAASTSLMAGA